MWPPPNFQSFPSEKEIQTAKEEISTIELEIIETELRLDALRKSLSERKAWIAPIRTIPPEILSLIFIEASRADWKAPLVLQSISRRWRDVVVDSPKAWAFIPLSKFSSERRSQLMSLFLERSRNTPLHLSVRNDNLLGYMELLADRIECIDLNTTNKLLNCYLQCGHTFHRLERLTINISAWNLDSAEEAAWDMFLFPNLKVLDIQTRSFSLLGAILAAPEFPMIRHLTVQCWDHRRLADILTKCATSLESVDLTYGYWTSRGPDTEHEFNFPRLRYMRIADFSNEGELRFRFKAATPNLQAHLDDGTISTRNVVKVDAGSVLFLHVSRTPDLSRYPRLVNLSFGTEGGEDGEVIRAIECLRENPALCPNLELIEYISELTQEQLAKATDALMARGDVTGHIIQLKEGNSDVKEERMEAWRGGEKCGGHMPCNLST